MKKTFKKLVAVTTGLVLALGMSVGVAAADKTDVIYDADGTSYSPTTNVPTGANLIEMDNKTGTASQDVTVKVVKSDKKIYRVDVEWDTLTFTWSWSGNSDAIWNPDKHEYGDGTGEWDKTTANIKVTNHSNDAISFDYKFETANATTTTVDGVKGELTLASGTTSVATAEGTAFGSAPSSTVLLTISEKPDTDVTDTFNLDTIKIVISHN